MKTSLINMTGYLFDSSFWLVISLLDKSVCVKKELRHHEMAIVSPVIGPECLSSQYSAMNSGSFVCSWVYSVLEATRSSLYQTFQLRVPSSGLQTVQLSDPA